MGVVLLLVAWTAKVNADMASDMLRLRAEEVASATRANLEASTLGKAGGGKPAAARPKVASPKAPVRRGNVNLQPGDFGYGDPLQGKKFGGTTLELTGMGKPATDYSRVPTTSKFKGETKASVFSSLFAKPKDKEGTQPGDFGYGEILKGKKFGGTTAELTGLGKPATDYSRVPTSSKFKDSTSRWR